VNVPVAVPLHVLIGMELPGIVMVNVPPFPVNVPAMVMRAAHWNPPKPTVPVNEFPVCVICHVMPPTEPIMPGPMPGPIEMPKAVPVFPGTIESAAVPSHVPATAAPDVPVPGCVTVGVGDAGDAGEVDDPPEQAAAVKADSMTKAPMEARIRNSYSKTR
jgi:hypothetical protein